MKEIQDERELYRAVGEFSNKVWQWSGHLDGDYDSDPTPEEFIELLKERIEWLREHKKAVDKYLRKKGQPTWVRVIDGSKADSAT